MGDRLGIPGVLGCIFIFYFIFFDHIQGYWCFSFIRFKSKNAFLNDPKMICSAAVV
jgi:hypothetical protein